MKNPGVPLLIAFLLVVSGCANDPVNILLGNWEVDVEATVDHLIDAEEIKPEDRSKVAEQLGQRANRHTLVFDKDRMIADEVPFRFMLLHSKSGELKIRADVVLEELPATMKAMFENLPEERQNILVTYIPMKDHRAMFVSSATNDMNHLVWKKVH